VRILVLGDVGVRDDMVHIGDEAMFEEFVSQLRLRGARSITGISSNPVETAARHGIEAVANVGFSPAVTGSRQLQQARMDAVLAAAAGDGATLPDDDPAWGVIDAVRRADGVAVSGGGNMASIWPMHIFERATLAALARLFDKPFVVSGQTIGPELTLDDRALVAGLLDSARLVGLREGASLALVQELGVTEGGVTGTIDDATFLGSEHVSPTASEKPGDRAEPNRSYCAVTLAAHVGGLDPDAFAAGMAALLDRVALETGLEIVFFAHFASLRGPGDERGDSVAHRRVIDRMTTPARIEPTSDSRAAAAFSRGASLCVSSRYHPAIFAVSAGVPTVGVAVDDYTMVKLTGALGNFGQDGVVTKADVVDGAAITRTLEVWRSSEAIRAAHAARLESTRAASDAWWDRVAAALSGGGSLAPDR
jgi:polysaccharide pyruvyl transferase WcaK-like protein